jgi:nucleotide-binding universal stress UspA family protein
MTVAKILVPLNGTSQDAIVAAAAIRAAKPFNAHVSAVFIHPDPADALPPIGLPLTGEAMQAFIDGQTRLATDAAEAARETFVTACRNEGAKFVAAIERSDVVTGSYREYPETAHVMAELASLCDLVTLGQHIYSPDSYDTILEVLMKARQPVLLCAEVPERLFQHVIIGWDGGICAAHAMLAATPHLERARTVEIVTVDNGHDLQDVKAFLQLHGVTCSARSLRSDHRPIHETLLEYVETSHADTLVIGGYGHSRVHETLFGGVTIEMLLRARVPVFLMH